MDGVDLAKRSSDQDLNGNSITELLENFSKTKLTPNETAKFELLKENYMELRILENRLSAAHASAEIRTSKEFGALFTKISDKLHILSKMQFSEGR